MENPFVELDDVQRNLERRPPDGGGWAADESPPRDDDSGSSAVPQIRPPARPRVRDDESRLPGELRSGFRPAEQVQERRLLIKRRVDELFGDQPWPRA
jgi:hypothetical protein